MSRRQSPHPYRGHDFVGKINQQVNRFTHYSRTPSYMLLNGQERVSDKDGNAVMPLGQPSGRHCTRSYWSRRGSKMSDEDGDAVAEFIRSKGITRCPTACVLPTQGLIAAADRIALEKYAILRDRARRERAAARVQQSASRVSGHPCAVLTDRRFPGTTAV